ncbi:hypothetical protein ZHAS_00011237 [Anopheles sinensis]|uniref:Uncharacterized protein n=1 Tax=Anopheles sinensis TaxID=74873 RepID=A0A084VZN1_ANOSI|nr:hypothetical protein ZHAS_00011237 [Anopheles sinensis]
MLFSPGELSCLADTGEASSRGDTQKGVPVLHIHIGCLGKRVTSALSSTRSRLSYQTGSLGSRHGGARGGKRTWNDVS